MLGIVLIDDDNEMRSDLSQLLARYLKFEELDAAVALESDGSDFRLDLIEKMDKFTNFLFFLDIELEKGNNSGFDLAIQIRQHLPLAKIVFLTSHDELALLALENRVSPLDYIIKKDMSEMMESIRKDISISLESEVVNTQLDENYFSYKIHNKYYKIKAEEVYYFESLSNENNIVILHAKDKVIEIDGNLKDIQKRNETDFFRCHRQYLANLKTATEYDHLQKRIFYGQKNQIYCPTSIRRAREIKKMIKKYPEKWQNLNFSK